MVIIYDEYQFYAFVIVTLKYYVPNIKYDFIFENLYFYIIY